jgi:hypothetical protein
VLYSADGKGLRNLVIAAVLSSAAAAPMLLAAAGRHCQAAPSAANVLDAARHDQAGFELDGGKGTCKFFYC